MAKADAIITIPNPLLRQPSRKVSLIDKDILEIVDDMRSATLDWEKHRPHEVGVAMAAVQIGQPYKIVVVRSDPKEGQGSDFDVLINPRVLKAEGELTESHEGCLSVPDLYGKVARYPRLRVQAQNLAGETVRIKASGFLARVLQHEIDHLKGKLFIDRVRDRKFYKIGSKSRFIPLGEAELKKYEHLIS